MSDCMTTVGEVAEVFDGPHATPKKTDKGPYFLSISSLERGALDLSKSAHLNEVDFVKWTKRVTPQEGDVLFSYETRLGAAALMPPGIKACLGRRMGLLRPKSGKVIPEYLLYAYLAPEFQETIRSRTIHGATVDRIALKELPEFPIRVPPIDEQKAVVNVLSKFDSKVELNRQINQALEQIAQSIFVSWFVDFEPVKAKVKAKQRGCDPERASMCTITGKTDAELDAYLEACTPEQREKLTAVAAYFPDELEESELGQIPKGWRIVLLGDELDTLETGSRPKGGVSGISEGVPSIGAENIIGVGKYNYAKEKFVTSEFFEKLKRGVIQDQDFLLYKDGGKPGDFQPRVSMFGHGFPYAECAINEHVFRLRSESLGQPFLYFQIGHDRVLSELRHKGAKAAIPGINQKDVKTIRLIKPIGLIDEFNSLAGTIIESILKRSKENQSLSGLRDALLPKLLSGEIAVDSVV